MSVTRSAGTGQQPLVSTVRGVSDLAAAVADNIRVQRVRRRLRQVDVGEALHIGQRGVSHLEAGSRAPTIVELTALCRLLDVPLSELLHGAPGDDLRALGLL